jgi:putative pyruvate formate lyase activating enzyme
VGRALSRSLVGSVEPIPADPQRPRLPTMGSTQDRISVKIASMQVASYCKLLESGALQQRALQACRSLSECRMCPRNCGANRSDGPLGECKTSASAIVSSAHLHFGEEAVLVGSGGSGTLFFSQCNLRCVFCQNHSISHSGEGRPVDRLELADIMLRLQRAGAHNINLVSPSHVVAPILQALVVAAQGGLHLPLVYNSGGYDAVDTLRLLDGVVDIYMPDAKYDDPSVGLQLSGAPDYPSVNQAAIREMHRQVGDLVVNERGIATRGLLVRHLVLPEGLSGTVGVLQFLAEQISVNTYVNVMDQYRCCYRAHEVPQLRRPVTSQEVRVATQAGRACGLHRFAE